MSDVTITVGSQTATISQEAIDDLKNFHNVDAIAEITTALKGEEEYQKLLKKDQDAS